ncbi:MAG: DUF2399 domain-containing protein, partial [Peptostreptococcaceae bacterium]|nr:DUF2399 domain-containing protein [Peptostreptococcaceae bacterium]
PDIKLFYNGDFDFGGITIANRMLYRFGGSVSLIHYDKETYESITSEVRVSDDKVRAKLERIHPELREITEAIAERGIACYQESIMERLIGFIS